MSKTSARNINGMELEPLLKFIDVFIEQGVPLESYKRNIQIRNEFFLTIDKDPLINRTELKQKLAAEYGLKYKSIEGILFGKKERTIIEPWKQE